VKAIRIIIHWKGMQDARFPFLDLTFATLSIAKQQQSGDCSNDGNTSSGSTNKFRTTE
jgi:hypothetical protein